MDYDFLLNSIKYYMQKEKVAEQDYNKAKKQKDIIIAIFYKSKKANKEKTTNTLKEMNKTVKATKKVYKETVRNTSLNALRKILVLNNIVKKQMKYLLVVQQTYYERPNISTAKVLEPAYEDYKKAVFSRKAVIEVYQTAMQADEEIETSDDDDDDGDNNYDDDKL